MLTRHVAYPKAAFLGAPDLRGYERSPAWLKQFTVHLQNIAEQPGAHGIISDGITSHYGEIAKLTVNLPHAGDEPWIPAYETETGVDPMGVTGVIARRLRLSSATDDEYRGRHMEGSIFVSKALRPIQGGQFLAYKQKNPGCHSG